MTEPDIEDGFPDMNALAASFVAGFNGISLADIATETGSFVGALASLDPIKAAATYGGLLLQKRLQPNCLRLEVLVHFCLAHGRGTLSPTSKLIAQGYADVGRACGAMEDPPEDVFVGNILSTRGNYRVLEGTWESGTFYLQRIVNLAEDMPEHSPMRRIADTIHALLKLSDLACERAKLQRNELGQLEGESALPSELANAGTSLRSMVQFDAEELHQAGIDLEDLSPFFLSVRERDELQSQSVTHTTLERRPLCLSGDLLYLVLPTAISAAIRRFFIETLGVGPNREVFVHNLGYEYFSTFKVGRMLGDRPKMGPFQVSREGSMSCVSEEVDKGRFLNTIFFIDTLEGFEESGLAGASVSSDPARRSIEDAMRAMQESAAAQPGFRDGVTLLVSCGIGRGLAMPVEGSSDPRWHFEFLSAPDLCTLSEANGVSPLHLWRIHEMRSRLASMGAYLQNMNGLLNLYAWAESQKGHLVPHGAVPQDVLTQPFMTLLIEQNSLLKLRHEVATSVDAHAERFIDGKWLPVRTKGRPIFDEDKIDQEYGHVGTPPRPRILGACITETRCWWFEVTAPDFSSGEIAYQRWEMLGTWMRRAMRPLESAFGKGLRNGPVFWHCHFEDVFENKGMHEPGTAEDAASGIRLEVLANERTVRLTLNRRFDLATYNAENVAEHALVVNLVRGIAQLAKVSDQGFDDIVRTIVPNSAARQSHIFPVQNFRDHFHELLSKPPVRITSLDDAAAKLGLGWEARSRELGGEVDGKKECLAYLNDLVRQLENDLCEELRTYNKLAALESLLLNYEAASMSREHWHRSASAMLALRNDREATLRGMAEHEFKLNAVLQPTRILLEMAICESQVQGGVAPGELDMARLLTRAAEIYQLGGWSDLIFWDAMKPSLIIRPYGDVHGQLDFLDTVMDAFGAATSNYRYQSSEKSYAKNVEHREPVAASTGSVSDDFLSVWKEEFDVDFDSYRRFIDAVENLAIENAKPLFEMKRSELVALADTPAIGELIVDTLTLLPRTTWREIPDGHSPKEIMPWRFRRRLSALRRPILQLDSADDPNLFVSPSLLREGFGSMFQNYYHGAYPNAHLREPMLRYAGRARERDGLAFNQETAAEMTDLGWKTRAEVKITEIVGRKLDQNYGDVDVLAWDPVTKRVLIMECKDLQFRKTHGEIAEQVADFRGELMPNGKRDLLLKHLDRVKVMRAHQLELAKYLRLAEPIHIESHLVFSHPVPMLFATSGPIIQQDGLHVISDLEVLDLGTSNAATV